MVKKEGGHNRTQVNRGIKRSGDFWLGKKEFTPRDHPA